MPSDRAIAVTPQIWYTASIELAAGKQQTPDLSGSGIGIRGTPRLRQSLAFYPFSHHQEDHMAVKTRRKRKKPKKLLSGILAPLYPCAQACDWLDQQKSLKHAWDTCPNGEWLNWLIVINHTNKIPNSVCMRLINARAAANAKYLFDYWLHQQAYADEIRKRFKYTVVKKLVLKCLKQIKRGN